MKKALESMNSYTETCRVGLISHVVIVTIDIYKDCFCAGLYKIYNYILCLIGTIIKHLSTSIVIALPIKLYNFKMDNYYQQDH